MDQTTILERIAQRSGVPLEVVRRELVERHLWNSTFVVRRDTQPVTRAADGEGEIEADAGEMRVTGYSAVFDSDSELLYGFLREQIKRGAFKNTLKRDPDVRLMENHAGRPYARTATGTLALEERPRGLYMDALLDSRRQDARDLYYGVDRGDYSQQSFAFTVLRSEWRTCDCAPEERCDCVWERDILEIGDLFEVSVVTFPAYTATSVTVARESEPGGERNAQASDEEQRDTAPPADASTTADAGDPATAIRLWLHATGGGHHVIAGSEGGEGAG